MLNAIEVSCRHPDGQEILCAVDFRLGRGEKVVLLGANGTGKSTLLKVLNGLLPPTTGTVSYDGRVVDRAALREAAFHQRFRREVVLLFQNPDTMLFNPTVFDEIAFGPRQLRLDGVDGRVHHWAGELGVAPLLDRTPFGLSGGEKQRVCLAALLVLEPKFLLLDEPTANMDPRSTGWLVDFLADLNQTTLVTTHNLSLAAELGDRCLVLGEDHRLVYDGPVQDFLSDHDRLAAANLVHRHRHRHGDAERGRFHTHDWD
ncbi:MAG: energy-coupling factor ABC transporter ATP-binding protein [Thiocapsa sp.]|jgi:cobalt/nickel transport system ATP-binding protein|nr:ABC transporter ATP-binding protein [Thiocapsa sp.]MCG6897451.1 energy-coupling factor ABC transporter ATP-binding protein [Thiocapsa sp.]MCG6983792.1 energy-coupling factor ABC transporter ATP-binding protein [Thiocapsa sp.]